MISPTKDPQNGDAEKTKCRGWTLSIPRQPQAGLRKIYSTLQVNKWPGFRAFRAPSGCRVATTIGGRTIGKIRKPLIQNSFIEKLKGLIVS
jgi:hypothetical protein